MQSDQKLCRYCLQHISKKATVCHCCGRDQRWYINILQYLASTTAFIMVIIAIAQTYNGKEQLQEAKKQRVSAERAYDQALNAVAQVGSIQGQMSSILLETKASHDRVVLSEMQIQQAADKTRLLDKQMRATAGVIRLRLRPTKQVDSRPSGKIELLPASGIASYEKADDSGNAVIIKPSVSGQTIMGESDYSLSVQHETVTLELTGNIWIRK